MKKLKRTVFNGDVASVVTNDDGEIFRGDSESRIVLEEMVDGEPIAKNFNEEERFVKLYDKVVPLLREKLTPSEFIFCISLSEFVSYNDCILRKTSHGNSQIVDAKDIAELLNMEPSVVRRLISSLKKKGVLGQHETGSIDKNLDTKLKRVYTVNPYIYFRGVDINETVKSFYNNSGWN